MSNTNQDPRGPQGAQGRPYAPQPGPQAYRQQYQGGQVPPQPQMPTQPPESKFFQWIRSSGLVRTNDRVVAGVCGGIARELGWSVELVRVLMVVAIFFGGFGMALYAMGWALLPDELTGDIPLEQLLAGHWDWSYIGIVLCIIIGIFPGMLFGGVSLLGFLLAVLALYLLVNNGRRRFLARNGAPMGGPAPQGGQGAGRYQPGGYPSTAAPEGSVPKAAAPQGGAPDNGVPPTAAYAQGTSPRVPYTTPGVPPQGGPQPTRAMARPPRARRPGAGAPLVLLVFGLIVLSAALLTMDFTVFGLDATSPLKGVRTVTIYVGIITAVIGLVVMVLGIRGHRTGGLHPFVWIAMVTAMALMIGCTALGVATAVSEHAARSYSTVELDGRATIGSTKADMEKLSKGVYVEGDDYDRDILTIDLTDYAKHHDIHKVELNDGTTGRSSCPTGPINIVARDAQVKVLLPLGCSWAIADDAGEGSVRSDYLDTVGGRGSLYLRANPFTITDNDFSFVTVTGDDIHTDVSIPPFVEVKGALDGNDGQGDADEDDAEEPDTDDGLTYSGEWFGNDRIERFCQGVATNAKGQVEIGTNAGAEAKQLIKDGGYWPCAVDASKAVETPELLIAPNILLGATVSVEYPAIAKQ